MSGIVIHDQVYVQMGRYGGIDPPQKAEKLLMAVAGLQSVKPSEKPFDFPAPHVATKGSSVLSFSSFAPIGSDHFDAVQVAKPRVQRIAVVGLVADQTLGDGGDMSLRECVTAARVCQGWPTLGDAGAAIPRLSHRPAIHQAL